MTNSGAVDAVPIIGQPVAYVVGLLVLILVVFAESWAGALVTVAHESGHMVLAFFQAANPLAYAVTLLGLLGLGWVAVNGSTALHVAVAVGVAWLLLLGGAYTPISRVAQGGTADGGHLGQVTVVSPVVWDLLFVAVGLAGLLAGGYLLLHH